jgi:ketosteroid isomerase-like protein
MPENRDRAVEVNDATYAAWNAHDPDAVAAVFAEDAVVRDVGNPEETRGLTRLGPDGLVAGDVHLWDLAGLMAQLGAG